MPRDFKLHIAPEGSEILLTESVSGKDLTTQKCIVNIGQREGSDLLYPTKGTNIENDALTGYIVGINEAKHIGNLAAINTLYFTREEDYNTLQDDRVLRIDMQLINISSTSVSYKLNLTFQDESTTATTASTLASLFQ